MSRTNVGGAVPNSLLAIASVGSVMLGSAQEGASGSAGRTQSTSERPVLRLLPRPAIADPGPGEGDAMSRPLPDHPNLDHLRRQAKALRDAARAGDPAAL